MEGLTVRVLKTLLLHLLLLLLLLLFLLLPPPFASSSLTLHGMPRRGMAPERAATCRCLALLMLLVVAPPQSQSSCNAAAVDGLRRLRGGFGQRVEAGGALLGGAPVGGVAVYAAEERKVYSGANPLHNR